MKNKFLLELKDRGFLSQCTDLEKLSDISDNQSIKAYIGFDCTASSLHVGSLMQIMVLKILQKYGHQPIILLGGGTTMIGDPSGKDTTRKVLDQKNIKKNISSIKNVFTKILNTSNKKTKPLFVNNYNWLSKLNYINFLRDIGSHFTLNKMLTYESVKLRLDREQSLSYMEFNYMILQAYDFYQLFKSHKCILQIGGSDQWGNIVNGVDLIRRKLHAEAFGLTTPLITLASGAKMGKTEKGAVWLNENLFSSYDYWQFWRNTDDRDVKKFLKYFTEIDTKEIEKLSFESNEINKLKILLANEATKILHGKAAAKKAEITAKETFTSNGIGLGLPEIKIKKAKIKNGFKILDLLSLNKIVASKSEGRRAIKNKAIKINNETLIDENKLVLEEDFLENNILKISFGKKKHYIFKII